MRLQHLLISAIFIGFSVTSVAQTLSIPYAPPATVDGVVSPAEWDSAVQVEIRYGANPGARVRIMHDSTNLFILFTGSLESGNRFPEILIDPNFDRSPIWMNDDWWFHVSATDCAYQGQPQNYDSCIAMATSWTGVPNMSPGPAMVDTIEIMIPLAKLGKDISSIDSFGLCAEMLRFNGGYDYWPIGAHIDTPRTWSKAVLKKPAPVSSSVKEIPEVNSSVFPNPCRDGNVSITWSDATVSEIQIADLLGNVVKQKFVPGQFKTNLNIDNLSEGVYLLWCYSGDGELLNSRKLVVAR